MDDVHYRASIHFDPFSRCLGPSLVNHVAYEYSSSLFSWHYSLGHEHLWIEGRYLSTIQFLVLPTLCIVLPTSLDSLANHDIAINFLLMYLWVHWTTKIGIHCNPLRFSFMRVHKEVGWYDSFFDLMCK